jgi:transcriptional regulator with XRE-family HTH domain
MNLSEWRAIQVPKKRFLVQLVDARLRQNTTQRQLAANIGIKQAALARIESGRGNPTLHTLLKIAQALDTELKI